MQDFLSAASCSDLLVRFLASASKRLVAKIMAIGCCLRQIDKRSEAARYYSSSNNPRRVARNDLVGAHVLGYDRAGGHNGMIPHDAPWHQKAARSYAATSADPGVQPLVRRHVMSQDHCHEIHCLTLTDMHAVRIDPVPLSTIPAYKDGCPSPAPASDTGHFTVLFRSGSYIKQPFVQRPWGFSSPMLNICSEGYRSR